MEFLIIVFCSCEEKNVHFSDNQDELVLKKVYAELLQYNPNLKKNSKLEKLAQSHGCVRSHSDHRNSWQDKAALKNDPGRRKTLSSIIGEFIYRKQNL